MLPAGAAAVFEAKTATNSRQCRLDFSTRMGDCL